MIWEELPAVTEPCRRSKNGFSPREHGEGLILARPVILKHRMACFAAGKIDGADFLGQPGPRRDGALVGTEGEFVLLLARDFKFPRQNLGGFAHIQAAYRIREAQLQRDARLEIGGAERAQRGHFCRRGPGPGEGCEFPRRALRVKQRHLGHALRAADNEDRAVPAGDALGGGGEGFETGGAIAMDGGCRHGLRKSGAQGDDAGDIGGIDRLADASEDDLVHQSRIESGAGQKGIHGDASQFVRGEAGKFGAGFAERGAETLDND